MNNKNVKTVLFASLIVAMILPFSGMMMAEAAQNEKANDTKEPEPPTLTQMEKNTKKIAREKITDTYMDSLSFPAPRDLSKDNTAGGG